MTRSGNYFIKTVLNPWKGRLYIIVVLSIIYFQACGQTPAIKRRSESFFGLHFDFHAVTTDNQIGVGLEPAQIKSYLSMVRPDYIQVDTKGHPGISSYPTKIGVPAPSIVKDPLQVYRAVTKELGIGLYSHFSGVIDERAVKDHPDWARVNGDGNKDRGATSLFGPYCDNYFIPQLKELSRKYGIDGVWVDGEVWAVQPDFSENAKKAYVTATGKPAVLNREYMDFTRRSFHNYLRH